MQIRVVLPAPAILLAAFFGVPLVSASTVPTQTTLAIPAGTVVGSIVNDVEYFRGIPFAQAPVGPLRLRPPVRASLFSTVVATGVGPSCPQMTGVDRSPLIDEVSAIPEVATAFNILIPAPNVMEDCLTISVMRPLGTPTNATLPVLFWIYGGGYETGTSANYNGSVLVPQSVAQGTPIILVAVNYRLGGFGFLPGRQALAEGATNLGLLDQRMGLEWVADNIAAFGGDPDKVTIWGQSVGSFSVFNQMALYNGNISYKKKPLFRAGIMNSGTIWPTEPVDAPRAQAIFDTVARAAGCDSVADKEKLNCLRSLSFEEYLNATNSVPSPFSYHSPVSSYFVRQDGRVITESNHALARKGLYAPVPIIVGDQEDEGPFLALTQSNLTTECDLITFLHTIVFQNASLSQVRDLVATYPYANGSAGSPFGTGTANQAYPQFKRLAAILGDITFTMMRRVFLSWTKRDMKAWNYIATYGHGTPIMGTFHTMDLPKMFYGVDDVSRSMQARYIAFVNSLDPNHGTSATPEGFRTEWPVWWEGGEFIEFGANGTRTMVEGFRNKSYQFIKANMDVLRV
ncbi:alpha/beta-hydrolase [Thozetella sp. PMI_491]|nr:alpha/beta-hydrolase [Thozetella sp. PMI_491]